MWWTSILCPSTPNFWGPVPPSPGINAHGSGTQAWTGHCAVVQAPTFDEHRRPLAPSKLFDVCVTEKNYGYVIL